MIKLHISKIRNKILLPQEEFYKIVEQAKRNEEIFTLLSHDLKNFFAQFQQIAMTHE